jgi:hypothetical protein
VQTAEGWRAVDAGSVGQDLQNLRHGQPLRFAFQSSQPQPKPVTLQLTRGETQMRADSLATTTVTDFTVIHALALQWQIDGAPVESLSLTTPDTLSGRLDFQGSEIREVTEAPAENGRVRWTIWFRSPVAGKYFAIALAALPPVSDQVAAPAVILERAAAAGQYAAIENQRQYVLVINGSTSQLSLSNPDAVETVQRDDLPIVVPAEQIDQGMELVRLKALGTGPVWTMQKFARTESIPASVNVADLTTVVARDGTYRTQAIYTIKNRRRQFLALRLPENSVLLTVLLNGQPARCVTATVEEKEAHLVALPKTSEADLSFPVKLVIAGKLLKALPRRFQWSSQTVEVPAPQVIGQSESDAFGIPVARTKWTVYLADDLDARAATDPKQHNLTVTSGGDADLVYASAAIQELNELLDVYENAPNYRQKDLALDNSRKQLGVVSDTYSNLGRTDAPRHEVEELQAQQQKVIERFSKVQSEAETIDMGRELKRNSEPAVRLNFGDQTDALDFAFRNNRDVLAGNRIMIQHGSEATDESFQLGIQEQAVPLTAPAAKPEAKDAVVRGLQTRGAYQQTNEANIGDLNVKISGKKAQQQQQIQDSTLGEAIEVQPGFAFEGDSSGRPQDSRARNYFGFTIQDNTWAMQRGGAVADGEGQANQFFEQRAAGGMGGGGMGGGAAPADADDDGVVDGVSNLAGWTQAGGLSLPMELPIAGQKLVYTKTGGDPKLALVVRPKAMLQVGAGVGWVVACLVGAFLLSAALRGSNAKAHIERIIGWGMLILGILGWCLLPEPFNVIAMIAVVLGTIQVMWTMTAKPA